MKAGNLIVNWHYLKQNGCNGSTICLIENAERVNLGYGTAVCSLKDNFRRDIGRKLSLTRAMTNIGMPKEERTVIWELYRNMTHNQRW